MVTEQQHRARLCGGPADGLVLNLDQLPDTLEQPEPNPGPDRPNPAPYRIRHDRHGHHLTDALGQVLYAYDWLAPHHAQPRAATQQPRRPTLINFGAGFGSAASLSARPVAGYIYPPAGQDFRANAGFRRAGSLTLANVTWTANAKVTSVEEREDGTVLVVGRVDSEDTIELSNGDSYPALVSNTEGRLVSVEVSLVVEGATLEVGDKLPMSGHFTGRTAAAQTADG